MGILSTGKASSKSSYKPFLSQHLTHPFFKLLSWVHENGSVVHNRITCSKGSCKLTAPKRQGKICIINVEMIKHIFCVNA